MTAPLNGTGILFAWRHYSRAVAAGQLVAPKGEATAMDPLSHLVVMRIVTGRGTAQLLGALAPDVPWHVLYPLWIWRSGRLRQSLASGDWPMPPQGIKSMHHMSHSLLVALACLALCRRTRCRRFVFGWIVHVLVDLPSHAADRMPPRPLWPVSAVTVDGFSWADRVTAPVVRKGWLWLRRLVERRQRGSQRRLTAG